MTALEFRRFWIVVALCLAVATVTWQLTPEGVSQWAMVPINIALGFGVGYLVRKVVK